MKTYTILITLLPIQSISALSYNPRNKNDVRRPGRLTSGRMNDDYDYDYLQGQDGYERYVNGDYDSREGLREPYRSSQRRADSGVNDRYLDSLIDRIDMLEDSRREIRNPQGQRYNNIGETRQNYARQGIIRRGPVIDPSYTRSSDSRGSNVGRGQYSSSSSQRRSPGYVEFGSGSRNYPDSQRDSYDYGTDRRNGNFLDRRRSDLDSTRNYDYYGDEYRRDQRYRNNYDSRYNNGYGRRGDMSEYDRYGRKQKVSKTILGYLTSYSLHLGFVLLVILPLLPDFLKSFPK